MSVWAAGRCRVGIAASGGRGLKLDRRGNVATLNVVRRRTFVQVRVSWRNSRGDRRGRCQFRPVRARPYGVPHAPDPDHRPGQRRQGGRRPRAPARGAAARSGAGRADVGRRRRTTPRELAGAGLVFGTEVTTFPWLMRDLARAAGIRARPLGRLARAQLVRAAIADVELQRAEGVRARARGSRRRSGTCSRSCSARWPRPPRFARARAWRASGRTRRAHAGELAPLYSAYHAPAGGAGGRRRRRARPAALDAARDGVGRPPALPLRLRRAPARPSWTSWRRSSATPTPRSRSRSPTSPAAPRWPAAPRRSSCSSRWPREHVDARAALGALRPGARSALHHLERWLFEPAAPRASRPTAPSACSRRAASAPRPSSSARRCWSCCATAWPPEDIAVLVRGGRRDRALRPGLRDLRHPGRPRAPHPLRPHPPRHGPAGLRPRRPPGGTATTSSPGCARPGKLAATAHATGMGATSPPAATVASPTPRRPRRAGPHGGAEAGAAPARAELWPAGGAAPLGGRAAPPRFLDVAARAHLAAPRRRADRLEVAVRRARGAHGREARWHWERLGGRELTELDELADAETIVAARCSTPRPSRSGPRRTSARRRRAHARGRVRRARGPRAAGARSASSRASPRPTRARGTPQELLDALGGVEVRDGDTARRARPASCSPTRWRSARAASARSSCAACRRASCRSGRMPGAVPGRRRARGARAWRPGSCSRAMRTRSRASARCSTRASRGPRRRCS